MQNFMIMSRYNFKERFKRYNREEARSWAKDFLTSSKYKKDRNRVKNKLRRNFIANAYTLLVGIDNVRSIGQMYDKRSKTDCYTYILNTLREEIKKEKPS